MIKKTDDISPMVTGVGLEKLNHSPIAEDQLVRDVGGSVSTLSPALVDLELEGRIKRQAGGLLSLA